MHEEFVSSVLLTKICFFHLTVLCFMDSQGVIVFWFNSLSFHFIRSLGTNYKDLNRNELLCVSEITVV